MGATQLIPPLSPKTLHRSITKTEPAFPWPIINISCKCHENALITFQTNRQIKDRDLCKVWTPEKALAAPRAGSLQDSGGGVILLLCFLHLASVFICTFRMVERKPSRRHLRARSSLLPTAPLGRHQPGQEASERPQTCVEGRTR